MAAASFRIWYPDGRIEDRSLGTGHHEIGRSAGAIILDDPGVSTRHARLYVEEGRVGIEDLGSSNGTMDASGQRIVGVQAMQPQQPVQIGRTRIALISIAVAAPGTQLIPVMSDAPSPPSAYDAPPGYGAPPPGYGAPPPGYGAPPPGYGAPPPGYGAPPPGYGAPPPGYGAPPAAPPGYGPAAIAPWQGTPAAGVSPAAPYGIDASSGLPFSDKSKLVAGLLQLFFGSFAVGRFYLGYTGIAIAQVATVFIIGAGGAAFTCGASLFVILWPAIDGILMLVGKVPDAQGRPLRP
ncbi:MAG: NINE protein [Pseudomonadota bacterium]